jgi:hypothetical protein
MNGSQAVATPTALIALGIWLAGRAIPEWIGGAGLARR